MPPPFVSSDATGVVTSPCSFSGPKPLWRVLAALVAAALACLLLAEIAKAANAQTGHPTSVVAAIESDPSVGSESPFEYSNVRAILLDRTGVLWVSCAGKMHSSVLPKAVADEMMAQSARLAQAPINRVYDPAVCEMKSPAHRARLVIHPSALSLDESTNPSRQGRARLPRVVWSTQSCVWPDRLAPALERDREMRRELTSRLEALAYRLCD